MIEIALCLAIIGFALVSILLVLPSGMNTQRETREETIINQDASMLLEAIRNGSRGALWLETLVEVETPAVFGEAPGSVRRDELAVPAQLREQLPHLRVRLGLRLLAQHLGILLQRFLKLSLGLQRLRQKVMCRHL